MVLLVGEEIHKLALGNIPFGPLLYENITRLLLEESFCPTTAILSTYLKESMPEILRMLLSGSMENKLLGISRESAKFVGYPIDGLKREDELSLAFESAVVILTYILFVRSEWFKNPSFLYTDYDNVQKYYSQADNELTIKKGYPLKGICDIEQRKLIQFANFMKLSLTLVQNPKLMREHLIDIVTRVAEHRRPKKYTTGSGQSPFTSRRVAIYHMETGVVPLEFRISNDGTKYKVANVVGGDIDISDDSKSESIKRKFSSLETVPLLLPVANATNIIIPTAELRKLPFQTLSSEDFSYDDMTSVSGLCRLRSDESDINEEVALEYLNILKQYDNSYYEFREPSYSLNPILLGDVEHEHEQPKYIPVSRSCSFESVKTDFGK